MEKKSQDKEIKIDYQSDEIKTEQPTKIEDIWGTFRVVDTAPTGKPLKFGDQIVVYKNDVTYRLYWYDPQNNQWHYIVASA